MQGYKVLLASVAAAALIFSADAAQAQKAKLAAGVLLTAAEYKALGDSDKNAFVQRQALENSARSRIFKAAKRGRFDIVGERFVTSLVHEGLFLDDDGLNVSQDGSDVFAEVGLDRFIGGSSTEVKFNVGRFLPTLLDADGNQLDSSILRGISAGTGGLKVAKNGIDWDQDTGDVSVTLKPLKGGFKHNQFVNLKLNLDGYGKVDVTYWLNEGRPSLIEGEVAGEVEFAGDEPGPFSYSPAFSTFVDNVELGEDGDFDKLFAGATSAGDETEVVSNDFTGRKVNARSTVNGFGQMVGFVSDGKMLRGVYGQFFSASPSS